MNSVEFEWGFWASSHASDEQSWQTAWSNEVYDEHAGITKLMQRPSAFTLLALVLVLVEIWYGFWITHD